MPLGSYRSSQSSVCTSVQGHNDGVFICLGWHNKIPHTAWLKQKTFIFSDSFEGQKSKIKVPAGLVSGETPFLAYRWPFLCAHSEEEISGVSSSSYQVRA